jgi:NADH dehydrogenase [ubiquinone] 1 alpha subcomplex assembly factor 2
MDMARRERVLRNAQLIEAKDREESEQLARLRDAEHAALMAAPLSAGAAASAPAPNTLSAAHSPGAAPPTAQPSRLPKINNAQASDAEAWAPRARVRGE